MPVSRGWSAVSLAAIVVSLIYPYVLGGGPEGLSAADLRDLRFQHYLRTLSLLALWLVAPRGPGLGRAMFGLAALGLFFSNITFAADGLNRILWGLTALTAVWAVHYAEAAGKPSLADGIPGVANWNAQSWPPSGAGYPPPPLSGNGYPPTGPAGGAWPPPVPGADWTPAMGSNGYPPAGSPGGAWPPPDMGQGWNQPLNSNGYPPAGSPGGVWPPPVQGAGWNQPLNSNGYPPPAGGGPASRGAGAAAWGLFKKDDQPTDIFSRVCDWLIKANLVVLVVYCVGLVAWAFFGQYGDEPDDEMFGRMFAFLSLPFVVAPSILLPGLMNAVLVKAGGGRQIFVGLAGTAAAASLVLVLLAAADPLVNGPLSYDRFEALAGFLPAAARWAGAAAILAALALLISRKLEGDDQAEYPELSPARLVALPPLLGLAAAALTVWAGNEAYSRFFVAEPAGGTPTVERLGPLEIKLPQGFKMTRPETVFQLEKDGRTLRALLHEYAFDTEEEAAKGFAELRESFSPETWKKSVPDVDEMMEGLEEDVRKQLKGADPEQMKEQLEMLGKSLQNLQETGFGGSGAGKVVDLEGREHQTFLHSRWYKRPASFEEHDIDMPEWVEVTFWQKRPGGYFSLELRRDFKSKGLSDNDLQALVDETLAQLTAWADATFLPAYRWVGQGGQKPAGLWVTAAGYIEGDLQPGATARFASRDRGFWGQIAWNTPLDTLPYNLFSLQAPPRSVIGRAADHYRGRAGLSRSTPSAGSPGRETLTAGRQGCMLQYGCRNIELSWSSASPQTPLRLEMQHSGLFNSVLFNHETSDRRDLRSRALGQWQALLQGISLSAPSDPVKKADKGD